MTTGSRDLLQISRTCYSPDGIFPQGTHITIVTCLQSSQLWLHTTKYLSVIFGDFNAKMENNSCLLPEHSTYKYNYQAPLT